MEYYKMPKIQPPKDNAISVRLFFIGGLDCKDSYLPAMESPSTSTLGLTKAVKEGEVGG